MLHGATTVRLAAYGLIRTGRRRVPQRGLLTLAIETSCDDTCVAILEKQSHLDAVKNSTSPSRSLGARAKLHFHDKVTAPNTGHEGIHPIEALESHRANLALLISRSLHSLPTCDDANGGGIAVDNASRQKPDFISVTRGPGMRSNLSCGLDTAKGLSVAWQVPLLAVHHMQAHALTPRLVNALEQDGKSGTEISASLSAPEFPFLTLLVSGGHTMLLHSTDLTTHKILATTADVAIGDALDKSGRILLPESIKAHTQDTAYAKYLSAFAFPTEADFKSWKIPSKRQDEVEKPPNQFGWWLKAPFSDTKDMAFSFASIASRIEQLFTDRTRACGGQISSQERLLFARAALGTAFEHLGSRTVIVLKALRERGIDIPTLVVSGGVAANDFLRYYLREILDVRGFSNVQLVFPPVEMCTDNAAMIAWTGMEMYEAGYRSEFDTASLRKWSMDPQSEDGGILGVGGWTKVEVA